MKLIEEDKRKILSAFTKILKKANGKGPTNIHIKYSDEEIHFNMTGVVSHFERYMIDRFNEEAIEVFSDFYKRDCYNVEKELLEYLKDLDLKYSLKFCGIDIDFVKDRFSYKMNIILI